MARARNIKPSFFTNDTLAECQPLARLLFAGLWTIADREGRLEDRPKKIKAELLPYDECDIESLLSELIKHGFITRYEVDKNRYIQVLNFVKHQNPHMREATSTIPAPVEHGANSSPSLNPHPPSLNPHPLTPDTVQAPVEEGLAVKKFVLPEWIPEQDWKDFCSMRGKGFTARARELIISDLDKLRKSGQDPGEVLRQSIKNGWKGIFEIKENKNGNGNYLSKFEREAKGGARATEIITEAIRHAKGVSASPAPGNKRIGKPVNFL